MPRNQSYIERAKGMLNGSVTALMEQLTASGVSEHEAVHYVNELVAKAIEEWQEEAP